VLTFSQDHVLVLIYNVTKYICLLAAFQIKAHLLGRQYMVIFHIAKRFSVCTYLARRLGCVLFILFFIYTESVTLFTAVGVLCVTFMHPPTYRMYNIYIIYIYRKLTDYWQSRDFFRFLFDAAVVLHMTSNSMSCEISLIVKLGELVSQTTHKYKHKYKQAHSQDPLLKKNNNNNNAQKNTFTPAPPRMFNEFTLLALLNFRLANWKRELNVGKRRRTTKDQMEKGARGARMRPSNGLQYKCNYLTTYKYIIVMFVFAND